MKALTETRRPTIEQFRSWREKSMADFRPGIVGTNKRRAACRVHGGEVKPGEGVGYVEFMTDGYRASDRYVCRACEIATRPTLLTKSQPTGERP